MTFPKSQRWFLIFAAALALPAAAVTWWMLASDAPQGADFDLERTLSGSESDPTDDLTQAEATPLQTTTERADGTAQRNADADDFQQYAETLRAQGQLEQTVRDLVSSRITAAFQVRRAAIRNQSRREGTSAADLDAKLDTLNRAQGKIITRLVGVESVRVETASTTGSIPVLMPAVMAAALPATVKTEEQAAKWEAVRHDFIKAIGGENQDPADPEYRRRWVQAGSEADQRFRLLFGDTAYVQHQLQARHESAEQARSQGKQ